jgi:hypothetical protein
MQPLFRHRAVMAVACAACLALAAPALADSAKGTAPDAKTLDRYLHTSLRTVINHGVELYNSGRVEDCYEGFRQSLQDLAPVLSAHPDLQKSIKEALDKVESDPQWRVKMAAKATMPNPELAPPVRQKAFALRAVFNDVRTALAPEGVKPPVTTGDEGTVDGKVVLDGKPLAKGKVSLSGAGGKSFSNDVTDGSFKLNKVAVGDYKVAVTGAGVPAKYGDAKTSGLTTTVRKGGNLLDLDLKGEKPAADTGTVEGKVTDNGKPLAKGNVTLVDKDGKKFTGAIAPDGTYSVDKVPPGEYKVGIDGGPAKFADPEKSGLTLTVKKGKQTHDIPLQ